MNLKLAFVFWAVMVVIAIANGVFGQSPFVTRLLGDHGAHLYRTFFAMAVIFVFSRYYLLWAAPSPSYRLAFSAGLLWLSSSLFFEFVCGHYVFGFPWERIISEYRITEGRLWSLVIASEVAAPLANAFILLR